MPDDSNWPITIEFPLELDHSLSANAKLHWRKRNEQKILIESLTASALMCGKVRRKTVDGRIELLFQWDSGLDLDNHSFVRKAIIDALSKYMCDGEDNNAYIGRIAEEFYNVGGNSVRISIRLNDDLPFPYLRKHRNEERCCANKNSAAKKPCATKKRKVSKGKNGNSKKH